MTGTTENIYFVKAESAMSMFKQAAQTLGATIPTSILGYKVPGIGVGEGQATNLSMEVIDGFFLLNQTNLETYALQDADSVIFEMPAFTISQEIATGMSIYMANIAAAVGVGAAIKVVFYTRLLDQTTPTSVPL